MVWKKQNERPEMTYAVVVLMTSSDLLSKRPASTCLPSLEQPELWRVLVVLAQSLCLFEDSCSDISGCVDVSVLDLMVCRYAINDSVLFVLAGLLFSFVQYVFSTFAVCANNDFDMSVISEYISFSSVISGYSSFCFVKTA